MDRWHHCISGYNFCTNQSTMSTQLRFSQIGISNVDMSDISVNVAFQFGRDYQLDTWDDSVFSYVIINYCLRTFFLQKFWWLWFKISQIIRWQINVNYSVVGYLRKGWLYTELNLSSLNSFTQVIVTNWNKKRKTFLWNQRRAYHHALFPLKRQGCFT